MFLILVFITRIQLFFCKFTSVLNRFCTLYRCTSPICIKHWWTSRAAHLQGREVVPGLRLLDSPRIRGLTWIVSRRSRVRPTRYDKIGPVVAYMRAHATPRRGSRPVTARSLPVDLSSTRERQAAAERGRPVPGSGPTAVSRLCTWPDGTELNPFAVERPLPDRHLV